jgi:hypothetical protein
MMTLARVVRQATLLLTALVAVSSSVRAAVDPALAEKYKALTATVNDQALAQTIRELSSNGSRVVGYPGEKYAAAYVEQEFKKLFGSDNVKSEMFTATVPMDKGARLDANGKTYPLYCIWPNLVRTSQLPEEGLSGPLIYAGNGLLGSFNGKEVEGAIVLVDFNSGTDWLNAPRLGAKAVVFIEPDKTMRGEAEAKFVSIPLSIPRFFIKKSDAAALQALSLSRKSLKATLHAEMKWDRVQAKNFIGVLPGQSKDPKIAKQIIVVQSYYDGMSVVPALAPAAEQAGGIAGLLQTARTFQKVGHERTIWFLATSGHCLGLQGVREFLDNHIDDWQVPGPFAKLFGQAKDPSDPIYLWVGLDLASQTRSLGIFYKAHLVNVREDTQNLYSDIARVARENNDKVAEVLGYDAKKRFSDGVNPVDGKSWRNFIPGKPAFDSEIVGMAGGFGVTFASIDDSRNQVDTPFDTFEKVNIANLALQLKTFVCLLQHYVNDPNDQNADPKKQIPLYKTCQWTRMGLRSGFATLKGRVREYEPRRSLVPSDPVDRALVVVPHNSNTKSFIGVRANFIQMVGDDQGGFKAKEGKSSFAFKGLPPTTADNQEHRVESYHMDEKTGDIDYAPDKGVTGAAYPSQFRITTGDKEVLSVVFPCVATNIFDLVDQQALRTLSTMTIYDGVSNGEPRQFGYSLAKPEPGVSYVEDTAVVFARRGDEFSSGKDRNAATNKLRQFKIIMGSGPAATRFLLINSTIANPEGEGYVMGAGEGQDAVESSRSSAIIHTALRVAQDMWKLDDFRIQRLIKNNIRNKGIESLHANAKEFIDKAEAALAAKDYQRFDTYARAAWGYESRAYPDVTKTQQDVVNGVIFYLALMIPFAYFLERLLFGYSDLKRQLGAVFLIFLVIFGIFAAIHPAFRITLNAGIILLAFIMMALSVLVTVLVWQKFEQQLKQQSKETQGTHSLDAGKGSIAVAAFALGVANMRRRATRTALTCATLVLLTFTVLAFTSIVQELRFNQVPAPGKPLYNGILLRDPNWNALQQVAYRLLDDEFGNTRQVAPRGWFLGTQPGEQTFLTLKRADREFGAKGGVGLSPNEAKVTHADEALAAGRWFAPGDTLVMILPRKIADNLRISDADVTNASAKVSFSGQDYSVIGILDQDKFKQIMDHDQEPLTPVDFVQMQQLQKQGKTDSSSGFQQYLHLDSDVIFFVPYQTLINLGGDLRSVAIGYGDDEGAVVKELKENLMKRFDMNLYAASEKLGDKPGKIERFSSVGATKGEDFGTILIPILIAALIVLNTMLGSVFERVKEIHIFSSIGLSPSNIGTLFMAEALVYAILGSVSGYVLGQGISKLLSTFHLMQGLSLNFSSVSAVLSTLVVVAVVLLSTLWPAKKASEVASPSSTRTWSVPDPVGDDWAIRLPFAVTGDQAAGVNGFLAEWFQSYEGYSVGDFITEGIFRETFESEKGTGYRIGCKAWLAPFDLGVSQMIRLETVPTDFEDVFDLKLTLHRVSGDVSNWKRVNRRFMNTLRKQFLVWRTLSGAERERYLTETEFASVEA